MEELKLKKIIEQDHTYYMNTFGERLPVCFTHGEGVFLFGTDQKKYMDLLGGIAVNVLGHGNKRLVDALCLQASRLIHCSNLYYIEAQAELAEKLVKLSGGLSRAFFANSGAEVNEGAIKLARSYFEKKGQPRVKFITAVNSFHGRTLAAVTATGQSKYHNPFRPLPPGFSYIPYNDIKALEEAVDADTCAVMLELIQGESGIIPASAEYIEAAVCCCKANGALLIIDEVQTGMGRTGSFFAYQQHGIVPDMATMAKGLGGGVPIGALLAKEDIAAGFGPGDHGTTFGGNPLACAAALAVLQEYEDRQLVTAAKETGSYFMSCLGKISKETGRIKEVRGKGLMIGIELVRPEAVRVKERCLAKGYLVNSVGTGVIRLLPPLILTQSEIDLFCVDFAAIITEDTPDKQEN